MKNKEVKSKTQIDWDALKDKSIKYFKRCLNKTKKFFIKVWNYIKKIVKRLKDKFMELPKKMRHIIYVWGSVVVVLLFFILATSASKKFYTKYHTFEDNVSAAALKYIKTKNIYATVDNKLKVNLDVLKEENYVNDTVIDDKTCEGISVIYYDDATSEYVIDSYLNCKKYTSEHYWDYK